MNPHILCNQITIVENKRSDQISENTKQITAVTETRFESG